MTPSKTISSMPYLNDNELLAEDLDLVVGGGGGGGGTVDVCATPSSPGGPLPIPRPNIAQVSGSSSSPQKLSTTPSMSGTSSKKKANGS